MSEFVLLFRSTEAGSQAAMGTPEQAQRSLERWFAWLGELEANGNLKDRGQPLDRSGAVVRGTPTTVTDGPYVEAKEIVLGFNVISARDLAHATELAARCPIALGGGCVEVRPVMTLPTPDR
jgi:hypothetical protein